MEAPSLEFRSPAVLFHYSMIPVEGEFSSHLVFPAVWPNYLSQMGIPHIFAESYLKEKRGHKLNAAEIPKNGS